MCVTILNNATEDKPFSEGGQRNRLKSAAQLSALFLRFFGVPRVSRSESGHED
jgi:hypothetical protein